jgi:hypothetical protein
MVDMLSGKSMAAARELGISGDPHGVARGWFMWPANFDPVWLRICNGFKAKAEAKPYVRAILEDLKL